MNTKIIETKGNIYFTSDWHAGEIPQKINFPFETTHSYLHSWRTDKLVEDWLEECHKKILPEDTLIFLGDLAITLEDFSFYQKLPPCRKVLILGDKEYASQNFSREDFLARNHELQIFDEIYEEAILSLPQGNEKISWYLAHKPEACLKQNHPSLCGHIHGVWRTQAMPNGNPIINVGVDVWGHLVEVWHIQHQYNAIMQGYYDINCRVDQW